MEYKRLRKGKTIKSEQISALAGCANDIISGAAKKQLIETIKIPAEYTGECVNINNCGYEIMRVSRNMSEYCAAIAGTDELKGKVFELGSFFEFISEKARPFAEINEIRFLCKLPNEKIFINSEKERLTYAIFNIIRNSMEHTPPKGKIKIRLSQSSKFAKILIVDNGEGMDEEILCHCGEPLFSGDRTGKKMGIGLTVAEHFIRKCGGRIKIRSEKGKGTSVSVFIPLAKDSENLSAKAFEEIPDGGIFIPAYISFAGIGKTQE